MFDKKAIAQAKECVRYIKSVGEIKYGKTRLNFGKGEQYGNTPVEFSIIFKIGEKFFHFFTSDFRWNGNMVVRECENERDFRGGSNYNIASVAELKNFVERKIASA